MHYPRHKELAVGSFVLNLVIGIIVALVARFMPTHFFKPYSRGFYCNDESIRYPFTERTVIAQTFLSILLILPFLLIFFSELYRSSYRQEFYSWRGYNLNQIFVNTVKYYAYYSLSLLLAYIVVYSVKYTTGQLRPNFIAVCQPITADVDILICKDHTYVRKYVCVNESSEEVINARLSFFSGRASFIFTFVIFILMYLQSRIPRKNHIIVVRALIQMVLLSVGCYISYAQILDAQNHWQDVFIGIIAGSAIGYFIANHTAMLKLSSIELRDHEAELAVIESDSEDSDLGTRYKTSVVRVEPTELRIFD